MSALGEYIHLRKYNYNLYGLQRANNTSKESNNLIEQTAIWMHRLNKIKIQFNEVANKDDQILDYLNGDTIKLKQFMQDLQDAKTENYQQLKEEILKDTLKDEYNRLQNAIQINWATGAVSTAFTENEDTSIFTSDTLNLFKRIGQNERQVWFGKDEYEIGSKIVQTLNQAIQECKTYFNEVFNKKEFFPKGQVTKYRQIAKDIGKELKMAESLVQSAQGKTYDLVKAKIDPNRKTTDKTKTFYLNTDFDLKYSAQHLVNIIEAMKVPNLSNIRGSLMEHLYYKFIEQGGSLAFSLTSKALGELETQGIIQSFKLSPDAAKFLKSEGSEKQKYHLTITKTKDSNDKDKIIDAELGYNWMSQRKADVRVALNVESTNTGLSDIGISIKNYTSSQIHLVSGASLLTFLFGDDSLRVDDVNHFLNILSESYGDTKAPENAKDKAKAQALSNIEAPLNIARKSVLNYTKLMILYKAATGKGLGKDASNNAEYILLNQPNKGDTPIFVSIAKLVNRMSGQINKITVRLAGGKNSGSGKIENYRFNNKYVSAPGNDIRAKETAIAQRLASVVGQLHQTKVSVAIAASQMRGAAGLK